MSYKPARIHIDEFFAKPLNADIEMPKHEDGKSPIEMLEAQTAYIEETSKELNKIAESARLQAESAKEIAESSKTQSELAINSANSSNNQAKFARTMSILSFIVSILAILIPLLTK